jgi:BirA family biotin operon repressor/biotin-[acetyl-CoA-carboxylase] ligase
MQLAPAAVAAGVRLASFDTIGSTNAEALARARTGERGPLWIVAREQTAGRGRRGRTWASRPGNLYATLLLGDPSPPEAAPQLSFVTALAVHDAIVYCRMDSGRVRLKWPNDVLLDGAKISGILIEGEGTRPLVAAIGIGVNCVHHPDGAETRATDLAAAGVTVTVADMFQVLSGTMLERLGQWDRGRGFAAIRGDWLDRAAGLGGNVRVRLHDREFVGVFDSLDEQGRLLVRGADGVLEPVAAGDVFPLPRPAAVAESA